MSETKFTPDFIKAQRGLADHADERPWYFEIDPDQQNDEERENNPLADKQLKIIASPGDGGHVFGIFSEGEYQQGEYLERIEPNSRYIVAACNNYVEALAEIERLQERVDVLDQTLDFHQQVFGFHPRATKLMGKRKPFLVVACDEPYYHQVYDLIRDHEMLKGTWTQEDQWHYDDAFSSKGR